MKICRNESDMSNCLIKVRCSVQGKRLLETIPAPGTVRFTYVFALIKVDIRFETSRLCTSTCPRRYTIDSIETETCSQTY